MMKIAVASKYMKKIVLWLMKWKKLITASIASLFFCMMLVLLVVDTRREYPHTVSKPEETGIYPGVDKLREAVTAYCIIENMRECIVQCSDGSDTSLSTSINKLNLSSCGTPKITLDIKEIYFTGNTISKGWLDNIPDEVEQLTISSEQLTDIEDSAFSGTPFTNLKRLTISDSRIQYIKKHSFKDTKLQSFEFRCKSISSIRIEFNALEYISDYLTILQFSKCIDDSIAVRNITGTAVSIFTHLVEIDLSYNTMTTLYDNSFQDATQLISLYLFSNNLKKIEENAFSGIGGSVQLLALNKNKLISLPEGVFNGFTRGGEIDISSNPWECNCDLVWLKEFYIRNIKMYFKNGEIPFICRTGNYSDINFCPTGQDEATTIPQTTTDSLPKTTEANEPDNFVYLNCTDLSIYEDPVEYGLNRIYINTVKVRNGSVTYNFYQIEGTPYFEMKLQNYAGNDYLIWINSKNSSDYGCVTSIQETVILNNLHYGLSYTICLVRNTEYTVTPFDCTSLTVPLEWVNRPWIINKYMAAVIGGVVGVTLALIIVTSVIIFYTIRQNPKLIKGNKRVVIVRNKSADALVMPNYEKQPYTPPSIYTNSEGYLTPTNKMYEKINHRRFRQPNNPSEKYYPDFTLVTPRLSRSCYAGFYHRKSVGSEVYEPPPLPPNHPCNRPSTSGRSIIYKN